MTTTTASGPATSPLDLLPFIRQGRHAAAEPQEPAGPSTLLTADLERVPMPDGPVAMKVRIARDRRQLRRLGRKLAKAADDSQAETEVAMRTLARNLQVAQQALEELVDAGRTRHWGPNDFEPGDQVRLMSVWYDVLAVGPLGLTVRSRRIEAAGAAAVSAEYTKVTGRLRHGVEELDGLEDAA